MKLPPKLLIFLAAPSSGADVWKFFHDALGANPIEVITADRRLDP
jgi:hypothetical protein